jgi:TRAP-type C4-dicarboxylate transport system permease small subunit
MKALGVAAAAVVRVLEIAAVVVLGVILAINTLEIVARTAFDTSFQWIYEVNLLLACWLYFLGIVPVYARGGDITLLGYERLLHGRSRDIYRGVIEIVTAATFAVIAWYAWTLIELQLPFRTPGMRIPNALFTAPLLVGLVGLTLVSLRRAAAVFRA